MRATISTRRRYTRHVLPARQSAALCFWRLVQIRGW
jgi:hypothetical protein